MPFQEIVGGPQQGSEIAISTRAWPRCFDEIGSTAAKHWTAVCNHYEVSVIADYSVR
jgi:hypothetical protein